MPDVTIAPRRALLVEDEFLVSLHVGGLLKDLGFEVVGPAARLADGLRRADQEDELAVGVLDINLAGELSWPIARLLRARGVPVIFVSGYSVPLANLPPDLADAPLCTKPATRIDLSRAIAKASVAAGPSEAAPS
jgi:CheY-like chemotaxis protein